MLFWLLLRVKLKITYHLYKSKQYPMNKTFWHFNTPLLLKTSPIEKGAMRSERKKHYLSKENDDPLHEPSELGLEKTLTFKENSRMCNSNVNTIWVCMNILMLGWVNKQQKVYCLHEWNNRDHTPVWAGKEMLCNHMPIWSRKHYLTMWEWVKPDIYWSMLSWKNLKIHTKGKNLLDQP